MPHALDRPKCPAALRALAGAVLLLSLGVAADGATAQTANKPQPAQTQSPAGQKPAAAPNQASTAASPVEAHLAELKTQLKITAAQQPKFDEFAKVLKQNAETMQAAMQKGQQSARQTAVEGLRAAASLTQTEADNLKQLIPAFEALYASLSAEQKRTADEMFGTGSPSGAPSGPSRGGAPGRPPG